LRPQHLQADAFQKDTPNDYQKVAQRIQIGEPLHDRRHVGNRKHKAAEHEKRQNEKKLVIMACCWVRDTVEINRPIPRVLSKNTSEAAKSKKTLPTSRILNQTIPNTITMII
jgi:hypothetical protein